MRVMMSPGTTPAASAGEPEATPDTKIPEAPLSPTIAVPFTPRLSTSRPLVSWGNTLRTSSRWIARLRSFWSSPA